MAFSLTFAMTPASAFADTSDAAITRVASADSTATVADGNIRLTKQDDGSVLVELLDADAQSAVDLGLEARGASGAPLSGAAFAFTPEAEALPIHHDVDNGPEVRLVVSNGMDAISSDGGTFMLGTLAVPADAAKVAVTNFRQIDDNGTERTATLSDSEGLSLAAGAVDPGTDPTPDNGNDTNTNTSTNTATNTGTNTATNTATNTSTNTPQTGNRPNVISETVRPTVTGTNAQGMRLAQTSDTKLLDASALLLIGGGAALLAAVIIAFRRRIRS